MFDYLYEWIQNIAFYMVMVTVVMHIIPNSVYKKYIRFFTGLVLVVMMTSPILKLIGVEDTWHGLYENAEYQEQVKKMEEATKYLEEVDPYDYLGGIEGMQIEDSDNTSSNLKKNTRIDVEEIRVGR